MEYRMVIMHINHEKLSNTCVEDRTRTYSEKRTCSENCTCANKDTMHLANAKDGEHHKSSKCKTAFFEQKKAMCDGDTIVRNRRCTLRNAVSAYPGACPSTCSHVLLRHARVAYRWVCRTM
jgi:hypothetical protein